jgi:ABC-type sulfate transport system substrate-binding protein
VVAGVARVIARSRAGAGDRVDVDRGAAGAARGARSVTRTSAPADVVTASTLLMSLPRRR